MEMHKDCGIGLPLVNREEGWHKKTLLQRVIEGKKAAEELEEEVRILYVALTRAIDRLEIVGTVKDLDSLDEEQAGKRSFTCKGADAAGAIRRSRLLPRAALRG